MSFATFGLSWSFRSESFTAADWIILIKIALSAKKRRHPTCSPCSRPRHGASLPLKVHLQAQIRIDFRVPQATGIIRFGPFLPIGKDTMDSFHG